MSDLSGTLGVATYQGSGDRAVIRVVGALDIVGAGRLIDETTLLDPGVGDRVVVDLDEVTLIDSAGIGALCYGEAFVEARRGAFAIAAPSPRTRAELELAGLDRCCTPADEARRTPPEAAPRAERSGSARRSRRRRDE